jgi:predicted Zn finger-like uncharacterized protein
MRVTCEACGAKYNLPDDKVRGRKAKVRCKRCSASIVVDGTSVVPGQVDELQASETEQEQPPAAPQAQAPDTTGFEDEEATTVMQSPLSAMRNEKPEPSNEWSVNVTDDEQRQMTTEQIVAGWASGEIREDTFVWREGMDDWAAVLEVEELAAELRAVPPPVADPESPLGSAPQVAAPLGSSPLGSSPLGSSPSHDVPPASAPTASAPPPASAPAPASAPRSQPRGSSTARAATFDLFGPPRTLERDSNPIARSTSATNRSAPTQPKHAPLGGSAENSVVFSLEALTAQAAEHEKTADSRASEDLLTMGGLGGAESPFSAPLIDPTKPPTPDPPAISPGAVSMPGLAPAPGKKVPVWLWAVGGIVILGVGFFGGRTLMAPEPSEDSAAAATATATAEPERKPEQADSDQKKDDEKDDDEKDDDEKDDDKKDDDKKDDDKGKDSSKSTASKTSSSKSTSTSSKSTSTKTDTKSAAPAPAAKFSVSAAKSALSSAAARAKSCKQPGGPTGTGKVQVTFATSGRVTSAKVVSGPFGGTSVGGCVARKFRSARVPAFSGSSTTVAKSFSIK